MKIREITENKEAYLDLLRLADPEDRAIRAYLDESYVFGLFQGEELRSIIALLDLDGETIEIKNLATYEGYQARGYASRLINFSLAYFKSSHRTMVIGTANSSLANLRLYRSLGFRDYARIENFFLDNYEEEIFEDGIQALDMILLKKDLIN